MEPGPVRQSRRTSALPPTPGRQSGRGILGRRLPAQCAHPAGPGGSRGDRCQDQGAPALRRRAVDGRLRAEQLHGAQCRGAEEGDRHAGREHCQGRAEPAEGHPAGPCVDDRRERVRGRPQRGHDRRRGGVRERAVPADRIQAADQAGVRAPVPGGAALHQQVLHPRPAAGELADPLPGGAGPSHFRDQLAQPRRVAQGQDLGRLHRRRRDQGHRGGAGDHGREADQRAGLLRRRHHPGHRAGGAGRARRKARGVGRPCSPRCSTSPTPACWTCSSTRPSSSSARCSWAAAAS